jgi:hypothetical protein
VPAFASSRLATDGGRLIEPTRYGPYLSAFRALSSAAEKRSFDVSISQTLVRREGRARAQPVETLRTPSFESEGETTMRFLIIPGPATSDAKAEADEPFDEKVFAAYMKYNEDMHKAGVLIASEGLQPGATGAHVSISKGKRTVIDGPFAETKELIAGFWLIEVKSKEEAIEWALRCPIVPGKDEVLEIRQLTGASDLPQQLREIIAAVAPTWSSSSWRSRHGD